MPVFLYYSIIETATGQLVAPVPQQGIFGVNSVTNVITVAGSTEPAAGYPACSQQSSGTCRVVSVLKYVQYAQGIRAGFLVRPAALQSCDITAAGSCAPQPMLTVGLTSTLEAGLARWISPVRLLQTHMLARPRWTGIRSVWLRFPTRR